MNKEQFEDRAFKEPNTGCWLWPGKALFGNITLYGRPTHFEDKDKMIYETVLDGHDHPTKLVVLPSWIIDLLIVSWVVGFALICMFFHLHRSVFARC